MDHKHGYWKGLDLPPQSFGERGRCSLHLQCFGLAQQLYLRQCILAARENKEALTFFLLLSQIQQTIYIVVQNVQVIHPAFAA